MKLAALGAVTAGIGLALDVPGLIAIGLFWMVMGLPVRAHGRKLKALRAPSPESGTESRTSGPTPPLDGRTFWLGTLLWLALGVPSLAVGILELGINAEHEEWRWLPIIVGGFALGIGVIGGVLYLMGSAALAVGSSEHPPDIPAVLRIRAVRETGTYINERPRMEFDFLVEPDPATSQASYAVTKKATVPFTAMAFLRVGDGFKALVAGPKDPTTMEIHWDQPVPGSATTADAQTDQQLDTSARLDELEQLRRDGKVTEAEYEAQRQRILGSL